MLDPMPMTIEMMVTRMMVKNRLPWANSIRIAENFRPRPDSTMPPMIMPSAPIEQPAEVLFRITSYNVCYTKLLRKMSTTAKYAA